MQLRPAEAVIEIRRWSRAGARPAGECLAGTWPGSGSRRAGWRVV